MLNMRGKTESIRLGLEVLTPVQAGSGQTLSRNLDYINQAGRVFVVDQLATCEVIASGNAALDTVLTSSKLEDLVKLADQKIGYELPALAGTSIVPDEIREQVKDAFLRPYIPGTALKGAIRTVLLAGILREDNAASHLRPLLPRPVKDRFNPAKTVASEKRGAFAADKLTKAVFGSKPNSDLLRALHVGDARFEAADLRLADIRWLNLTGPNQPFRPRWRDMGSRANIERWEDAKGVCAETLAPKTLAPVTLQWDGFLLSDLAWHDQSPLPNLLPRDFPALRERLNEHARHRLDREIEFFKEYRQAGPLAECERIRRLIDRESHAAYLQLSWGSGWRGMTGDWMDEGTREQMRSIYREMRGRDGMPFPKTRRLAVWNGSPCLALGWVRLMTWEDARNTESFLARRLAEEQQIAVARQAAEEEAIIKAEEARRNSLSKNQQDVEDLLKTKSPANKGKRASAKLFDDTRKLIEQAATWDDADRRILHEAAKDIFDWLGLDKSDQKRKALLRGLNVG